MNSRPGFFELAHNAREAGIATISQSDGISVNVGSQTSNARSSAYH